MESFPVVRARGRSPFRPAAHGFCAGALLASLLVWAGCGAKPAKSAGMQQMEFRVPVTVAKATTKNIPVQVEAIGNVEAYSNVSVRTQMAGEIERAYFTQGQDVKKGQLLFTLDRRPFQATLNQLERQPGARPGATGECPGSGRAQREAISGRHHLQGPVRHLPDHGASPGSHRARRPGRHRKRQGQPELLLDLFSH